MPFMQHEFMLFLTAAISKNFILSIFGFFAEKFKNPAAQWWANGLN
jgi:hypothetical protein